MALQSLPPLSRLLSAGIKHMATFLLPANVQVRGLYTVAQPADNLLLRPKRPKRPMAKDCLVSRQGPLRFVSSAVSEQDELRAGAGDSPVCEPEAQQMDGRAGEGVRTDKT